MEFIGRKDELDTLKKLYQQNRLKGAIIYGRRRFGKTSLLLQSAKNFEGKVIYYQCLKMTNRENAKQLLYAVQQVFPDADLFGEYSFLDVLDLIFNLAKKEPILFLLDEYPYLSSRDGIDSYLQSLMDHNQDLNMKIVLSGSYIGIMEHLLDADHPLHGRFLYKIHLKAFDYYDSSMFYRDVSNEDKIKYYSVLGGIPYYLSMIDKTLSFEENIKFLFLSPFAPLANEIQTTLQEEFAKIDNAAFVISLIIKGKHSYTDIKQAFFAQVRNSDLNYILKKLLDMNFISKNYAVNDEKKKSAYYEIEDNLFAFFYQIINPRLGLLPSMSIDSYYDRFIKEKLEHEFIPHRFEKICKEYLIRQNREGKMAPLFFEIGSYTYNNSKKKIHGQFDLMTKDDFGNTFYECKYTKEKIDSSVVKEEVSQLEECSAPYYRLGFFSKSGYDLEKNKDYLYFTLENLFSI